LFTVLQFVFLFITQVILARFLSPSEFGSFALVSTLVMFVHILGNTHADRFLIASRKDSIHILNVIFTSELCLNIFLIICSVIFMPKIMAMLGRSDLALHAQVFSIIVIHNPLTKPKALLEKELSFFRAVLPALVSNIIGGAVAVTLVWNGYGLWSLIWWKVTSFLMESLVTWLIISNRPSIHFDSNGFKESIRYSAPVMIAAVLAYICSNIDYYIINSLLNAKVLGFYWIAYQASHYLLSIRASVNRVIFPFVSGINSYEDQKSIFDIMTSLTSIVFLAIVFFVWIFGENLVSIVYGDKWLSAAILIKIFTCIVLFKAVSSNAVPLLHSSGITMPDLEISLLNFFLLPPAIFFMAKSFGPTGAAIALLVVGNIGIAYIHEKYVKTLCGLSYFRYYFRILSLLFFGAISVYGLDLYQPTFFYKLSLYLMLLIGLFLFYFKDMGVIYGLFKRGRIQ